MRDIYDWLQLAVHPSRPPPFLQMKADVVRDLQTQRVLDGRGLRGLLDQHPLTRPARCSTKSGLVPVLSKIGLRDAYYQFFVDQPQLNTAAPWDPERGALRFFQAPFLTFGNRWSVYSFQAFSELISLALCVFEVSASGCVDGFVILSPPELAPLYNAFSLNFLKLLGVAITTTAGGNFVGALGAPAGILGLHYTATAVGKRATIAVRVPLSSTGSSLASMTPAATSAARQRP